MKARHRARKKYYRIDTEFPLYQDLRSLFSKAIQGESPFVTSLKTLPNVKLILLAGALCGTESKVDLLLVGDVKKEVLEALLAQDPSMKYVKYSIFPEADFLYRLSLKDRFVLEILNDPRHALVFSTLQKQIEEAMKG